MWQLGVSICHVTMWRLYFVGFSMIAIMSVYRIWRLLVVIFRVSWGFARA